MEWSIETVGYSSGDGRRPISGLAESKIEVLEKPPHAGIVGAVPLGKKANEIEVVRVGEYRHRAKHRRALDVRHVKGADM
jgi:hypothetical protein